MRRPLLPFLAAGLLAAGCGKDLPIGTPGHPDEGYERVVLAELFTSLLCTNCPQAEAALDQLYEEEGLENLAVIHWHPSEGLDDPLGIPETDIRLQTYTDLFGGSSGLPSCVFDGVDRIQGGSQETYSQYRHRFDGEMLLPSPVSIALTAVAGGSSVAADVGITVMADTSIADVDLAVVLVEHKVPRPEGWEQGPDSLSFVARAMVARPVMIEAGGGSEEEVQLPLDASWNREKLYVVAFLQGAGLGEVIQAAMLPVSESEGYYAFTLAVPDTNITMDPDTTGSARLLIENTGTLDDSLSIDFPEDLCDLPENWHAALCDDEMCFGQLPHFTALAAGEVESTLVVDVMATGPGEGSVGVVVASVSEPALSDTVIIHFRAEEEGVYAFTLSVPDTAITMEPGDQGFSRLLIENTGTREHTLGVDLPEDLRDLPEGWHVSLCDDKVCYTQLPLLITLGAGEIESRLKADVTTTGAGEGSVVVVVSSINAPTLSDSVTIHFRAEEQEGFERVILGELFTAVWCTNCPEAEGALDRLYDEESPTRLAVIHWHPTGSDPMGVIEAQPRKQAYDTRFGGQDVWPACVFSGAERVVGGIQDTSYYNYRAVFSQQAASRAQTQLSLSCETSEDSVSVGVDIATIVEMTVSDMDLLMVLVEHEVSLGTASYSYVARAVATEQVSVGGGASLQRGAEFPLDPSWDLARIHIIAFLQEPDIGEVPQAAMAAVPPSAAFFSIKVAANGD